MSGPLVSGTSEMGMGPQRRFFSQSCNRRMKLRGGGPPACVCVCRGGLDTAGRGNMGEINGEEEHGKH